MPNYRFYCQDADRLIASGGWIHANSDQEATAFAKAKKIEASCEVWLGDHLVAQLAAYSGGSGAAEPLSPSVANRGRGELQTARAAAAPSA